MVSPLDTLVHVCALDWEYWYEASRLTGALKLKSFIKGHAFLRIKSYLECQCFLKESIATSNEQC